MKILFSSIKELIPDIKASPKEVGSVLSMIGFMQDGIDGVRYKGKKDTLIGVEVRQNRADCLSVIGLAREISAYYGLKCIIPRYSYSRQEKGSMDITVPAGDDAVKRIIALRIEGLKNSNSPKWLREFIELNGMNSINTLVDLSNFVMLMTGYPSHFFDSRFVDGDLSWKINDKNDSITTLDRTELALSGGELVICDKNRSLSTGLVGGEISAVRKDTTSVIAEVAVYNNTLIRKNSRSLSVSTEAGSRLEKLLDPNGVDYAMKMLSSLVLENCGGSISSKKFEYYPNVHIPPKIRFETKLPSSYSGIEISENNVLKILKRLRCKIKKTKKDGVVEVVPPSDRVDILLTEDIVEEVVRMVGFDKIPQDEMPTMKVTRDISSHVEKVSERVRDVLVSLGYDEIRSIPLTPSKENGEVLYRPLEPIITENSVNEEFPELRASLMTGLFLQCGEYEKKNIEFIKLFEIGRVFGKDGGYHERTVVGALWRLCEGKRGFYKMQDTLETMLRQLGAYSVRYEKLSPMPVCAHPNTAWRVCVNNENAGAIYKVRNTIKSTSIYFFEIDCGVLARVQNLSRKAVHELTGKIVTLDANIEGTEEVVCAKIDMAKKEINDKNMWSMRVVDVFSIDANKSRYTIRVSYMGLSDEKAKELHMRIFE